MRRPTSSTRYTRAHPEESKGVVVSFCPVASAVGSRVLAMGGNAADAAVATALALAITYPQAGNIGGGGFLLSDFDDQVHFLDFRETAPRNLTADMLMNEDGTGSAASMLGPLAVGVPGAVAGLGELSAKHGSMPWSEVLAAVMPLAEGGLWLTSRQAAFINGYAEDLTRFASTRRTLFPDGPVRPGDLFKPPGLARTMDILRSAGPRAFYEGFIAKQIVSTIRDAGGVLDLEDLAEYEAVWREPIAFPWLGRQVFVPSLPSGGGYVLRVTAGLLDAGAGPVFNPYRGSRTAELAAAFRAAFGVGSWTGDPDYQSAHARARLNDFIDPEVLRQGTAAVEERLVPADRMQAPADTCTTHFSVLDKYGNSVSCTTSLNTLFGAKLAVDECGFLLNNCIDDFRIAAHIPNWYKLLMSRSNQLGPNRRPLSSMCPTIVKHGGLTELVLGAAGGPRIPTAIAQVMLGTLDAGLSVLEATIAPRIHHQRVPDVAYAEEAIDPAARASLEERGMTVESRKQSGIVAVIKRDIETQRLSACLDSRFGDHW